MLYVIAPVALSCTDSVPLSGRPPLHPSPGCPPDAVQADAPGADQVKVVEESLLTVSCAAVRRGCAGAATEPTTSVAVLPGSRACLIVEVVLVVSAFEFHTADNDVKYAKAF